MGSPARTGEGQAGRGDADGRPESKLSALFPLLSAPPPPQPPSLPTTAPASWLHNNSFTFDASAVKVPEFPTGEIFPVEDSEDPLPEPKAPAYDLVSSSPSSSEEEKRRKRKKEERRRRKKRRRKDEEEGEETRRSGVRAWAGAGDNNDKGYHFDSRGDPDNLAFGSIYRMDVARYRRQNASELSGPQYPSWYKWKPQTSILAGEGDADVLDNALRTTGRYYSSRHANLERHRGFKHIKISIKKPSIFMEDFIPLLDTEGSLEDKNVTEVANEESWEDEVIQRTRNFNKILRESPHDETSWLAFANFQDKVANMQRQKAARLQTLEKKIVLLEKAVDLNPDSETLLLSLLKSYERRDSGEVLVARWEKILAKHFGSYRLWKEFLLVVQGDFSRFKVSEVRKRYGHALQALSSSCRRICRQGCPPVNSQHGDSDLVQLELGLVDIFLTLCRFEWQTGFQELATGLLQAQIEYSLFGPSLQLGSQSKLRLFEHFWNSGGPRVGEEGAGGWSNWIDKEEEHRQKIVSEDLVEEIDGGGWTGWFIPSVSDKTEEEEEKKTNNVKEENDREDPESEGAEKEDIEALLKKLGVNVDADHESEIKDLKTWTKWSTMETQRDHVQWMPVRESSDKDDDQLSRSILFEDVCDYLFSLSTEEARFCLLSRFVDFYGGKIFQWTCTNDPGWISNSLTLDSLPNSVTECLRDAIWSQTKTKSPSCTNDVNIEDLLGDSSDIRRRTDMVIFLRNSLLLCLHVFPRNHKLEEALLLSEELLISQANHTYSAAPSQFLAKRLLKNDRQNLLLSGLYARREAAFGNIDRARKVFDMTLSLTHDLLHKDTKENAPIIYLWYAEMEVDNGNGEESSLRAIHILSCLGRNTQYTPFTGQISNLQLLRSHNGFREQMKHIQSAWVHGCITDSSIAFVCSASLFEILTTGSKVGVELIEEAFSMALPERRAQSLQLESLSIYYIKLLQKYAEQLKLQTVWSKVLQQLQIYPFSPKILSSTIEVGCICTVPQKVRWVLDECFQRKPSVIILLFALVYELGRSCSQHRIRGLFERALANEQLQKSVILWRCFLAFEIYIASNIPAARRIFFRGIHACPWSKKLWLDGFQKLSSTMTPNELSDLHEVMRDKELNLRTDIYEILLQDEFDA